MKRILFIHPYLFAAASILFLYPRSAVIASPDQMIRPLLTLWFILTLISAIVFLLIRDFHWASLFTSIFAVGFCSHTLFFFMAGGASLIVLLIWYISSRVLKRQIKLDQIGILLSITAFFLGLNIAIPLVRYWMNFPDLPTVPLTPLQDLETSESLPDIYYIVLDGYGRADLLADLYGFDNSSFVQELESRGFIIPSKSYSNYPKTALSVTSTLNMDYVQSFAPDLKKEPYWWIMSSFLDHSSVRDSLENLGYQSVAIATDWSITNNPTVDKYYSPRSVILNDFESFYLSTTPLVMIKPLLGKFAFVPTFDSHGELILYNFDTIASIAYQAGPPKFVFAHILAPHPPFVFDAGGAHLQPDYAFSFNDANDFPYGSQSYREGYVGQVQFINAQIISLVDAVLKSSAPPPIIILQADHGPGMFTDFTSVDNTCLKERFSVFAAYYLPGKDPTVIPTDITPVNLFRIVFNQYFGANLPLLESRHYYYNGNYIYDSQDVTSQVDTCEVN